MAENKLYYGDNLDVLRRYVKDESVDLIYLDPPFNSRQDYNVLFAEKDGTRSASQIMAFEDTWEWNLEAERTYEEVVEAGGRVADVMRAFRTFLSNSDMMAYLAMMAPRLVELRRVLKVTGSIYLHCDPTASHYLKMLMDAIFGPSHLQNELVWKRTFSHGGAQRFGRVHDIILFYTKSDEWTWNRPKMAYSDEYLEAFFRFQDPDGRRYRLTILTGSGVRHGSSGKPWRGVNPTAVGRHWAIPGYTRKLLPELRTKDVQEALDQLDKLGRIVWPDKKGGTPSFKQYVDDLGGADVQDVVADIPPISAAAAERLGYPTQKPEALLERIIVASSNEGGVVLDPFCGCGTAVAVAHRLKRRWIGIDITHLAINLIKKRLRDGFGPDVENSYDVVGEPVSFSEAQALAQQNPFQFENWALGLVGARKAEPRRGADLGIDGRLYFHDDKSGKTRQIILSVKSGHISSRDIRDLRGVIEREKAEIGALLTLEEPTKPMLKEAASAGFYESEGWGKKYPKLQILTIAELLERKELDYPRSALDVTFKKAPKAKSRASQSKLALSSTDDESEPF